MTSQRSTNTSAIDIIMVDYETRIRSLTDLVNRGYTDSCSPEVFRALEDAAGGLLTAVTTRRTMMSVLPDYDSPPNVG